MTDKKATAKKPPTDRQLLLQISQQLFQVDATLDEVLSDLSDVKDSVRALEAAIDDR